MQGMVRVVVPDNGRSEGTRVYLPDGSELHGVLSIQIGKLDGDSLVKATMEMFVQVEPIFARPTLSEDNLRALAKANGFDLVPRV